MCFYAETSKESKFSLALLIFFGEQQKLKKRYQHIGNVFVKTATPYCMDTGDFSFESNNVKDGQRNRKHEIFILQHRLMLPVYDIKEYAEYYLCMCIMNGEYPLHTNVEQFIRIIVDYILAYLN